MLPTESIRRVLDAGLTKGADLAESLSGEQGESFR